MLDNSPFYMTNYGIFAKKNIMYEAVIIHILQEGSKKNPTTNIRFKGALHGF